MSFTPRPATPADGDALSRVARRCFMDTFGHAYQPDDVAAFLDKAFGPTGLAAQIGDPAHRIMLVEDGGEIAGFILLEAMSLPVDHPAGSLEIKRLYVLKPWQGRGVAQALIDWAIETARTEGAPALFLSVWADNARAIRFYERYGFTTVGFAPFTVGDQIDQDPVMRLTLA